jgi:hypothetical protein
MIAAPYRNDVALRGRYLNVLVTDDAAARAVLTRAGEGGHAGDK